MTDELIDTVTVMFHVADLRDYQDERIKAALLPGGEGFVLYQPMQPYFMYANSDDLKKFKHTIDGAPNAHKAAANRVCNKPADQRIKEVTYMFPDDMTCNQKYFNDEDEPEFLQNKFVMFKTECGEVGNKKIFQQCAYVSWEFVIEREARVLKTKKKKKKQDRGDEVAEAMKGMLEMSMENWQLILAP